MHAFRPTRGDEMRGFRARGEPSGHERRKDTTRPMQRRRRKTRRDERVQNDARACPSHRQHVHRVRPAKVATFHQGCGRAEMHERARSVGRIRLGRHGDARERAGFHDVRRNEPGARDELAPHRRNRIVVEESRAATAASRKHDGIDHDREIRMVRYELRDRAHVRRAPERPGLDRTDALMLQHFS